MAAIIKAAIVLDGRIIKREGWFGSLGHLAKQKPIEKTVVPI